MGPAAATTHQLRVVAVNCKVTQTESSVTQTSAEPLHHASAEEGDGDGDGFNRGDKIASLKRALPQVNESEGESTAAPPEKDADAGGMGSMGAVAASTVPILGLALMAGAGVYYKDDIGTALIWFTEYIETAGSAGYAVFMALYIGLEVLAVPAVPLTMSAGALFGTVRGTAMVSFSATVAATIAFLIARFVARDKIKEIAGDNPKFAAIDRAIGEDGFRVVALLRLSPLLPFALSNYLYGLTSVRLRPYVLASWLGMLPGTFAYVSAGTVGRTLVESGAEGSATSGLLQASVGLGFAVLSGGYVAKLATNALKDVSDDMDAEEAKAAEKDDNNKGN